MIDARIDIRTSGGSRGVSLASYLDPAAEEQAHEAAYRWIKDLRHLPVDGETFRERFTARGDSLWWFTEIYFYKARVVLDVYRTIAALTALIAREQPIELDAVSSSPTVRYLAPLVAAAHHVGGGRRLPHGIWWRRLASLDWKARSLTFSALLAADRHRGVPPIPPGLDVAAFIHRAFWRAGGDDGSAESYIGPVLEELEQRAGSQGIRYVGIGRPANFRTPRRWIPPTAAAGPLMPVERFAPLRALRTSRAVGRRRLAHFRLLERAPALRAAAVMQGIDCWPLVREQLAGVAWLQWPWSVRAMDEAAGALDALRPRAVLTYAEAGGWGRALVLEARRRSIPSVGVQHGFIYRHWLNYRHEPDEMPEGSAAAFPYPTRTLLFDEYAARHLRDKGHFPAAALQVTGSPRLAALAREITGIPDPAAARRELDLAASDVIVLVTTKESEARPVLDLFLRAAAAVRGAQVVIKPHPAETAAAYAALAAAHPGLRVVPPETSLAKLLAVSRAVVTVNSTVALDAGAFGIPALVIGLPNNLSPFVEAGVLAGAGEAAGTAFLLDRILYDGEFRQRLAARRLAVLGEGAAALDGGPAAAAADAVLALVQQGRAGGL